jgi:iron complex transport system substrate-binding protein
MARWVGHLDAAADQAGRVLPHLPDAAVWAIDADGLAVCPGPRLVDGVEALAGVLHPDVAGPAHPATARLVRPVGCPSPGPRLS